MKKDSICIAVPSAVGMTHMAWSWALKHLAPPVPWCLHYVVGLPVDQARNKLVELARSDDVTHLFFLDSDVLMPPDGLVRLYSHYHREGLSLIAGQYGFRNATEGRSNGLLIRSAREDGRPVYVSVGDEVAAQNGLYTHPMLATGLGCCLISMDVFEHVGEPYFRHQGDVGEDLDFFERAREAGFPLYIDRGVRCAHIDGSILDFSGQRHRLTVNNIKQAWTTELKKSWPRGERGEVL